MIIALVTWLATAKGYMGSITVDTLSDQWVSFAGNAAAIISGGILSIGLSLWRPANFDWEKTRGMSVVEEEDLSATSSRTSVQSEKVKVKADVQSAHSAEEGGLVCGAEIDGLDLAALNRTFKEYSFVFTVVTVIITFVSRMFPSQPIIPHLHFYLGYPCASERSCVHLLTKILHVCDRCHVCESKPPPFVCIDDRAHGVIDLAFLCVLPCSHPAPHRIPPCVEKNYTSCTWSTLISIYVTF